PVEPEEKAAPPAPRTPPRVLRQPAAAPPPAPVPPVVRPAAVPADPTPARSVASVPVESR
ncbi:hypothetical protein ACWEH1_17825, partial [Micromonospora chersina]